MSTTHWRWLASAALVVATACAEQTRGAPAPTTTASVVEPLDTTTTTRRSPPSTAPPTTVALLPRVVHVTDGDTLDLDDDRTIRLAQVDAPERGECFSNESTEALRGLALDRHASVRLPPNGTGEDRYGRTVADLVVDGSSLNVELIRQGAAEWYEQFADEDQELAAQLAAAEAEARQAGRGLWSACQAPPTAPVAPPTSNALLPPPSAGNCDAAYPDVCIPPAPPDLDCGDIPHRRFRVLPPDPHSFDGNDDDGVGCESG